MKLHIKWLFIFLLVLSFSACKDEEIPSKDVDPLDLIETAEDNLEELDTYSVVSNMAVEFGNFPPDEGYDASCNVDRANVAMYCLGGFELVRLGDKFWRSVQNEPWREPVESTLGRIDVLSRFFEAFGISAGPIRFTSRGFPTIEISDWVNNVELVQETVYEDFPVYEISFTVDDSYHDALNYQGGLATSTMGAMRETATTIDGSGTGTVYIDKGLILIRHLAINSSAQVDDFEAATVLQITFSNFNEPVTIPDLSNE